MGLNRRRLRVQSAATPARTAMAIFKRNFIVVLNVGMQDRNSIREYWNGSACNRRVSGSFPCYAAHWWRRIDVALKAQKPLLAPVQQHLVHASVRQYGRPCNPPLLRPSARRRMARAFRCGSSRRSPIRSAGESRGWKCRACCGNRCTSSRLPERDGASAARTAPGCCHGSRSKAPAVIS